MRDRFSISDVGLKLIKTYEGFRPVDMELISGQRVVGYGHRVSGDAAMLVTKAEAEALLLSDLAPFEAMINDNVFAPLSQSQFDALCSLAFNIGPKKFLQSDTLRALNNGRILDAAYGFDVWRRAMINGESYVVDALVRRRTAEKVLFLRPQLHSALAPRAELDAIMDEQLAGLSTEAPDPILEQSGIVEQINYDETSRVDAPAKAGLETYTETGYIERRNPDNTNVIKPTPMRRKDDHPGGVLTLSEIFDDKDSFEDELETEALEVAVEGADESEFENSALIEDTEGFVLDLDAKDNLDAVQSDDVMQELSEDIVSDIDYDDMVIVEGRALDNSPVELKDAADYAFDPERDITPQTLDASEISSLEEDTSPIAEAAAEVSERLDALMANEDSQNAPLEERKVLPFTAPQEELISSFEDTENETPDETPSQLKKKSRKPKTRSASKNGHSHPYNDLFAEQAPEGEAFDEGFNSADRYIEYSAARSHRRGNSLAFSLMTILGMALLGGSLGAIASGFDSRYGNTGNLLSSIGVVIGIMITLGSVYYVLKNSRQPA